MAGWDDDDWVGEPPEGHHTRDMADPGYWRRIPPVAAIGAAGVVLGLIVLIVVLLLQ
ncbi:MAG TPA: hypothetical protein VKB17_06095 [Thermoleophilaceae bacterium]|nr:hypothetical protein [Thermoleophilaceae bacterium]